MTILEFSCDSDNVIFATIKIFQCIASYLLLTLTCMLFQHRQSSVEVIYTVVDPLVVNQEVKVLDYITSRRLLILLRSIKFIHFPR